MKKVGVLTLFYQNYNFGGLLQAYALPRALSNQFKIDVEQIQYFLYEDEEKNTNEITNERFYNKVYKIGIWFFSLIYKRKINTRKKKFEQFMGEIPHSKKIYSYDSISDCLKIYQVLICGGDQIWNECNGINNLNVFTLKFATNCEKKISYAPSMAILELSSKGKECIKQGIEELGAISVRERRSIDLLRYLTDKKIEVVVDPVLLLKEEEWNEELKQPAIKNKYILCYLLNDSAMHRKEIERLSKKLNLKIITFPHILANAVRKCDLFFGDIHDYSSGPREFIGLIKNAEFVITDSFHACVFSMIFKIPFVVFERSKPGEKGNMNSRIYDFLEEYHLENQLVTEKKLRDMKEIPKVDFTYAHEHWKKRREESLEFLRNSLMDNQNGEER